jgi:hypothetical protein
MSAKGQRLGRGPGPLVLVRGSDGVGGRRSCFDEKQECASVIALVWVLEVGA